jgi:hypothetical protein
MVNISCGKDPNCSWKATQGWGLWMSLVPSGGPKNTKREARRHKGDHVPDATVIAALQDETAFPTEVARSLGVPFRRVREIAIAHGLYTQRRQSYRRALRVLALLQTGEHSMAEIGRMTGLTRQRVEQIKKEALQAGVRLH